MGVAVDDRDRAAPIALARQQPVAQAVVDRAVALAFAVQPVDDLLQRVAVVQPVELGRRVHQRAVAGVGQRLAATDDALDLQPELGREVEVALVVPGDGHDRAGAVLHQHVVGDVHRDPLAVDRVDHAAPQRHAGLRALGVGALLLGLRQHLVDVVAHRLLVLGAGGQPQHVRVLGRHDEERRAEQRVRAGGEDRVVGAHLRARERDLGALGAADPVALHRDHVVRPVDRRQVVQQAVGVVGDAEEPLLQLAQLDRRAAALAVTVDDLLVGQHRGVLGTPVDRGLLAVGQAALEQLQEDPLRPAVVARLVGAELARPVDRDAPRAELALEGRDRLLGRLARVLAGLDRVVLGRQAERVIAHRVQHFHPVAAPEVRDRVTDRVVLQMPHVGLAGRDTAAFRARTSAAPHRRRWKLPRCAPAPRSPATCARSRAARIGARP